MTNSGTVDTFASIPKLVKVLSSVFTLSSMFNLVSAFSSACESDSRDRGLWIFYFDRSFYYVPVL